MRAISLDYSSHNDKLVTSMHKNIFRLFATETKVRIPGAYEQSKKGLVSLDWKKIDTIIFDNKKW